jgi:hypothetical protein
VEAISKRKRILMLEKSIIVSHLFCKRSDEESSGWIMDLFEIPVGGFALLRHDAVKESGKSCASFYF